MSCEYGAVFNTIVIKKMGHIKECDFEEATTTWIYNIFLNGDTIVTDTAYKIAGKYAGAVSLGLSMAKAGIDEDFAIIRNTHSNKKQLLIDSVYNSYYRSDKNYDWRAIPSEVNNYASGNNSNLLKYVSINPD